MSPDQVTALVEWVLSVHRTQPVAIVPAAISAESESGGLWWGVFNVEALHLVPESMWADRDLAQGRAATLNKGVYPSWHAFPLVASLWMRNETPPDATSTAPVR